MTHAQNQESREHHPPPRELRPDLNAEVERLHAVLDHYADEHLEAWEQFEAGHITPRQYLSLSQTLSRAEEEERSHFSCLAKRLVFDHS